MKNPLKQPILAKPLLLRIAIGAGIGLLLISLLVFGVQHPDPAWGKHWMVRPLLIVSLAGATGGACSYFIMRLGLNKVVAVVLSLFVFLFGLWVGTILGLDGTLWD